MRVTRLDEHTAYYYIEDEKSEATSEVPINAVAVVNAIVALYRSSNLSQAEKIHSVRSSVLKDAFDQLQLARLVESPYCTFRA